MRTSTTILTLITCCLLMTAGSNADESPFMHSSVFDESAVSLRYALVETGGGTIGTVLASDESFQNTGSETPSFKPKSPGKAFALSMLLPGLGQYYNGSKVKPVVFLGVEVAAWLMYFKLDSDGDEITDQFEAYSREHWSEDDYSAFLLGTYGVGDDDSVSSEHIEINHHLPDTRTQQYYEMTGKYNQFAWGWDDAILNDSTLADYLNGGGGPPPVNTADNVPYSANRFYYEGLRDDANTKYDNARRMVYVALLNRLVSGFEAMFASKKHNRQGAGNNSNNSFFSTLRIEPKFKSMHTSFDTPYVSAKVRF